jgi:MFS family permease
MFPLRSLVTSVQVRERAIFSILFSISFCHLLNDTVQSLIPAIYPILKSSFHLDFGQIGLITLTFNLTASLLQPVVGMYTDRNPKPYSLVIGMGLTLVGLLLLSIAPTYAALLIAAWVRLSSIPSHRAWRVWLRAAGTVWLSRSFRWVETRGPRSDPCWRPSSSYRRDSAALRGFPASRCSGWSFLRGSAPGTNSIASPSRSLNR